MQVESRVYDMSNFFIYIVHSKMADQILNVLSWDVQLNILIELVACTPRPLALEEACDNGIVTI